MVRSLFLFGSRWRSLLAGVILLLWPFCMARGEVMISEIMYHPSSENPAEEYLELYNSGTTAVPLAGWAFTKGIRFSFAAETVITAGGRLVVAADTSAFSAKYPGVSALVVGGWTGKLSNSSDRLVLKNAAGDVVDEVEYADDGDWAVRAKEPGSNYGHRGWIWEAPADGAGSSLELIQAQFDNSSGQNWGPSTTPGGTPGTANSIAATDIAPTIREVSHFPLVPSPAETVRVTARVIDDHAGLAAVSLFWRLDGSVSFQTVAMFDDGQHADGLSGDGLFAASIPAQAQGAIVEFYVMASDATAHTRTWPAPVLDEQRLPAQTANCLYQVDGTTIPGNLPLYRLVMRAVDRQELIQINTNTPPLAGGVDQTLSEAEMNATFISRVGTSTDLRYRCGLNNRGSSSRTQNPASFRLALLSEQPWDDVVSINLNSQNTPAQTLGSEVFRLSGADMALSRPVRLFINAADSALPGSPTYGFYAANEVVDSHFADAHFPSDSDGNAYRGKQSDYTAGGADLRDQSTNPDPALADPAPYRVNYIKRTNGSEDRWADLIRLTQKIGKGHSPSLDAPTYDPGYVESIRQVLDVPQWMSYFAANTIAGNKETSLATGRGDDYMLYIGALSGKAVLLPYDLDTLFGAEGASPSDGLFPMCRNSLFAGYPPTPMNSFMKHPEFAPVYYSELQRMIDGAFSPEAFNSTADQLLGRLVPAPALNSIKTFNAQRVAWIRTQIPLRLSFTTLPPAQNGFPKASSPAISLSGRANAVTTRRVTVAGVEAAWTGWSATWSLPSLNLNPGINRVVVRSYDADGVETESLVQNIWYDDGSIQTAPAVITADTTWTAAGGPWLMNGNVIVQNNATLTIEPGTSVYATGGGTLYAYSGARLMAQGTAEHGIYFGAPPGSSGSWSGIQIYGSAGTPASIISYADVGENTGPAIRVTGADITLDHLAFRTTSRPYLTLDGSSFLVSHCHFPTPTAEFEPVHGTGGIRPGGRGIIRHCFFGAPNGYRDSIDFTGGLRPAPILQLIGNVFAGTGDDLVDLDGTDAWIEGNIFLHCHRNGPPDSSSAISGGSYGSDTSRITIRGNLFYDVDHAMTAKEGNYYTFTNNTVVRQTISGGVDTAGSVFNFKDDDTTPALGLYARDNILVDCAQLVRNYNAAATSVTLDGNLTSLPWTGPGTNNSSLDPLLVHLPLLEETAFSSWQEAQVLWSWLALKPGSPGLKSGGNGQDKGGVIPPGVSLSASVGPVTNQSSVQFQAGPSLSSIPPWQSGYIRYRWQLDGGAVSSPTDIGTPLSLTNLTPGQHVLKVAGLNDAGFWQDDPQFGEDSAAATFAWTIDPTYTPPSGTLLVRLNEVLARNQSLAGPGGSLASWVELSNSGSVAADISDFSLSDNTALPRKWIAPAGTVIPANGKLVIECDSSAAAGPSNTGFALTPAGGGVHLFQSPPLGGGLQDSVAFGNQLADLSIGRYPDATGAFVLNTPTRAAANASTPVGSASAVRINEWLADPVSGPDLFELYNTSSLPVSLAGLFVSDSLDDRTKQPIQALTFIGGSGQGRWLTFLADNSSAPGHTNFALSKSGEALGLFSASGETIDAVTFGPQAQGVSQGSYPDGSGSILAMTPSFGSANVFDSTDSDADGMPDSWEAVHGLNRLSAADATQDLDGDGMSNLSEYLADTDPRIFSSRLLGSVSRESGQIRVRFSARAGRSYSIQYSDTLPAASWQKLADIAPQPLPVEVLVPDPSAASPGRRFYRIVTPSAP